MHQLDEISYQKITRFVYIRAILLRSKSCTQTQKNTHHDKTVTFLSFHSESKKNLGHTTCGNVV